MIFDCLDYGSYKSVFHLNHIARFRAWRFIRPYKKVEFLLHAFEPHTTLNVFEFNISELFFLRIFYYMREQRMLTHVE